MRRLLLITLIALFTFPGCQAVMRANKETTEAKPAPGSTVIDEKTNIHYTGRFCSECHVRIPVKGGDPYLKFNGNYRLLCRCHHGMSPGYCHPIDATSESGRKLKIPADLPLRDGKFTCNTCHYVYKQCQKRLFDRNMLRGEPYPEVTDFCYRCHDKKNYKELNAHHQIQADGKLDVKMCLYCHAKKPDEKTATYKEVTFIGGLTPLCQRCHQIKGNHPANFDHIGVTPSAAELKRMEAMIKEFNIILPLTTDGKMTCVTCHNPHEKGVIAADKPAAKGADSKYRLRLPGIMCTECHKM